MKSRLRFFVYFPLIFLISCSLASEVTTPTKHVDVNINTPQDSGAEPTVNLSATMITPTMLNFQIPYALTPDAFETIYNNPNQTTDGRLKIYISEFENQCYKSGTVTSLPNDQFLYQPGDLASIIVTYENLENSFLKISDYNIVEFSGRWVSNSHARLIPILTTLYGERIRTMEEIQSTSNQVVLTSSPQLTREMAPMTSFDVPIKYLIPTQVLFVNDSGETGMTTIPAGQYLLKYVYHASGYQGTWAGLISSNQIQICLIN